MALAQAAAISAFLVAALGLAIALAAYRVLVQTGNRAIGYVVAAFALLTAKNLAKGLMLLATPDEPALAELAFSAADLAIVLLIALPLLRRRVA